MANRSVQSRSRISHSGATKGRKSVPARSSRSRAAKPALPPDRQPAPSNPLTAGSDCEQCLKEVALLAGETAHDLINLLTIIKGFTDRALSSVEPGAQHHNYLTEISKAGTDAVALTQQLLRCRRKQSCEMSEIDLNHVISGCGNLLSTVLGDRIQVDSALRPSLFRTVADPVQIRQILVNLTLNAHDAMPEGGRVLIQTANVRLRECDADGYYVCLAVTDNGAGMTPETQSRVFEPFFTTRNWDPSHGLGLSSVRTIVKHHGGTIKISSERGQGTTVYILLPGVNPNPRSVHFQPGFLKNGLMDPVLSRDGQ